MRTPDFVLKVAHSYGTSPDQRTLPAGTFVRPLELHYVPKHCISNPENKWFNSETEVFCYTRYGIVVIRKDNIKEVK